MKKLHISPGNTKLGPIPSFSLPPLETCPGSTGLCRKACYAKITYRLYKHTRACWENNLALIKANNWTEAMVHNIYVTASRYFRIHIGGDFFSQEYLDGWIEVCKVFPEIQFLAFTKSFQLDYSAAPDNLNIVWSVFPDTDLDSIPPGPKAITLIPGHTYPAGLLCSTVQSSGLCTACQVCFHSNKNNLNVTFEAHGGHYSKGKKQ